MKFLEQLDNEYCTPSKDWRDVNVSGCSRIQKVNGTDRIHMRQRRFDALGGSVVRCLKNQRKFGKGDSEKRFCWMNELDHECVVFSVGSRNEFSFEIDMSRSTKCRFEVFDCTVKQPRIPKEIQDRTRFHQLCLGPETKLVDNRLQFVNYTELIKAAGNRQPSYIKFDIEGAEYDVLANIIDSSRRHFLDTGENIEPLQIAFELHYATGINSFTSWSSFRTKTNGELFSFSQMLLESGGYLISDIRINTAYCAEIVIVKVLC